MFIFYEVNSKHMQQNDIIKKGHILVILKRLIFLRNTKFGIFF
jgi:hypothetical protein